MGTTPFTFRIDADLKARLEKIADSEDRSASYMAVQAVENLVKMREAKAAIIRSALESAQTQPRYSSQSVVSWVESWGSDTPAKRPAPDLPPLKS